MLLRDPFRTGPTSIAGPSPSPSSIRVSGPSNSPSASSSTTSSPVPSASTQAWCTVIVQSVGLLIQSTTNTITAESKGFAPIGGAKTRARGVKASPSLRAKLETKAKTGVRGVAGVLGNLSSYQSMCRVLSQLTRATSNNSNNSNNAWSWQGT